MAPVARPPSGSTVPQCAPFLPCPHGEDRGGRSWGLGQNNSIQFNSVLRSSDLVLSGALSSSLLLDLLEISSSSIERHRTSMDWPIVLHRVGGGQLTGRYFAGGQPTRGPSVGRV